MAEETEKPQEEQTQEEATVNEETVESTSENTENTEETSEIDKVRAELGEAKDKFVRLYSDFDNFRRRTAKEKTEFFNTAQKDLILELLPVLDDFERAIKNTSGEPDDDQAPDEGMVLIYNKMSRVLEKTGLKMMEAQGEVFNPDLHEAITKIPAPSEELKGKIVDVIEKGYFMGEKVVRYAKVVIGS